MARAGGAGRPGDRSRRRWAARAEKAAIWVVPEDNPTGVIYGTITTGALLVAESTRRETILEVAAATAVAFVLYFLVHAYASALGERLDEPGQRWAVRRLGTVIVHELALLKGAGLPLVVLVGAGLAGVGVGDATTAAVAAAVLLLVVLETIAGFRGGLGAVGLVVQIVVSVAIGVGVFALKIAIH